MGISRTYGIAFHVALVAIQILVPTFLPQLTNDQRIAISTFAATVQGLVGYVQSNSDRDGNLLPPPTK